MNIIRDLQFPTTFTLKNQNWKLSENRFQELVQNCGMRNQQSSEHYQKSSLKRKFVSYEDLELIISKDLELNNIKSYEILLVVITFVSSILSYSFCLIYPPLTTLDCVANLVTYSSCFCRINLFSYLLIYFILLHTLLYYILIDCQIIQILLLLLFLNVNVRNKHSNKMADKSRAIVFTLILLMYGVAMKEFHRWNCCFAQFRWPK